MTSSHTHIHGAALASLALLALAARGETRLADALDSHKIALQGHNAGGDGAEGAETLIAAVRACSRSGRTMVGNKAEKAS